MLFRSGAMLPKIVELAKKEMRLPVRIGFPEGIIGLDGDPTLSTVAGLVLEGADLENSGGMIPIFHNGFGAKVKKVLNFFNPNQ